MIKDKLKKLLSVEGIFIILLFILFCYLFVENFVFSESYDMTQFQWFSDDEAFNISIYNWQTGLKEYNFKQVFSFNDWAYGWIFWAFNGIITFPFYILGMEQMVISTLRNLSLIMSFASLYFIYKILGYYTKNKIYKILAILIILSSDVYITYCLYFDTTAMIRFFGILSIFFIIKDKELSRKTILYSALCLGIAVGIKLMGGVFVPLVGLLLLDRLKNKEISIKIKVLSLFASIFILSCIFFTNPLLILFPIFKEQLAESLSYYFYFSERFTLQIPPNFNTFLIIITDQEFCGYYNSILLIILYFSKIIRDIKKQQYDFIYYFITFLILPICFLFINEGASGLVFKKYYAIIMIFLPFSIIELENYKKIGYFVLVAVLFIIFYNKYTFYQGNNIFSTKKYISYNRMYINKEVLKRSNTFLLFEDLRKIIKPNKDGLLSIWMSNQTPISPYSSIRPFFNDVGINYNVEVDKNMILESNYDYYIIDKNPPYCCFSDEQKENYTASAIKTINDIDQANKKICTYTKIYDNYDMVVYKRGNK